MAEKTEMNCEFLRKRMEEFRKSNNLSLDDMAKKIKDRRKEIISKRRKDIKEENSKKEEKNSLDRSTLYRAESGKTRFKKVKEFYAEYWKAIYDPIGLLDKEEDSLDEDKLKQRKKLEREFYTYLRGERVVVVDTSAIEKKTELINDLSIDYSIIIIPAFVFEELVKADSKHIKNSVQKIKEEMQNKPAQIIEKNDNDNENHTLEERIILIAENVSKEYNCEVEIITCNENFGRKLKEHETVKALLLDEYIEVKHFIIDMENLKSLNDFYEDEKSKKSYDDYEDISNDDINATLPDGNTLIISAVINKEKELNKRKAKINWLIKNGAKVNKRDIGSKYMPALSHAILADDFDMFKFLLDECGADPNCGSRNPFTSGKIRQDNEGVMPLMLAAERNMSEYVEVLLNDKRISINQQDGYGRTALIIAGINKAHTCIDLLKKAGADEKIVDRDGCTYGNRVEESYKH